MSGIALRMALKRVASFSDNTHKTNIDHLPEKRDMIFRTGHASIQEYFFKFSFKSNFLILNISYFKVTAFQFGNFL